MYTELMTSQTVPAGGATIYTQAFEIGADNAVFVAGYVSANPGTGSVAGVNISVEGSNDMVNWIAPYGTGTVGTTGTGIAPVAFGGNVTGLAARYLRLNVTSTATSSWASTVTVSVSSRQL